MGMMQGWSASMSGWDWFWMVAGLVVVCALAGMGFAVTWRYLRQGVRGSVTKASTRSGAEEVLAQRFARGEIGEDEYWQRVHALRAVDSR